QLPVYLGLPADDSIRHHGRTLYDAGPGGPHLRGADSGLLARHSEPKALPQLRVRFGSSPVNSAGSKSYCVEQNSQLTRMRPSSVLSSISSAVKPARISRIFSREHEQSSMTGCPS